jgi:serine/threonine-protein kinase
MARFGKYVVTGELGRGGRAIVHSALDPVIGRAVAIKVIRKAELDPAEAKGILNRFRQGAQAAGVLQHSNIVAIYEYGEDEATA